jgi:hypothetical protein
MKINLKGSEMNDDEKQAIEKEFLAFHWPTTTKEVSGRMLLHDYTVAVDPSRPASTLDIWREIASALPKWTGVDYAAPESDQELVNIRQLIAGAVYDFAGRLTTGQTMQVGSAHNAAPMAEACEAFLRERGCSDGEPMVKDWNEAITALELSGDVESKQETTDALRSAVIHAVNLRGFDQQACNEIADDVLGQMGL